MDNEDEARRLMQLRKSNVHAFRRLKWGGPRKLRRRPDQQVRLENYVLLALMIAAIGTYLTVTAVQRASESALLPAAAATVLPISY